MQHRNAPLTPNGRRRLVALRGRRGPHVRGGRGRLERGEIDSPHLGLALARGRRGAAARPELPRDRSSRPGRSPAQVPDAEAKKICERREKTGWSPRRLAEEPDIARPALDRAPRPAPRRLLAPTAARAPGGGPLRVALPRQPPAHGRQEAGPLRGARSCADRRPPTALATGRLGVRALDRRRLLAPGLRGDPRRRAGPDRHRLHPPGVRVVRRAWDRGRETDDRQPLQLHEEHALAELLDVAPSHTS